MISGLACERGVPGPLGASAPGTWKGWLYRPWGHGLNSPASLCRVPVQAGARLKVGEPATCSPTITTHMAPQEASLKTSLARMMLCLRDPGVWDFSLDLPASGTEGPGAAQGCGWERVVVLTRTERQSLFSPPWHQLLRKRVLLVPTPLLRLVPRKAGEQAMGPQEGERVEEREVEKPQKGWNPVYICIYLGRTGWGGVQI